MQEIYVENIKEILRNKNKLVNDLKIKLNNKGKNFFIDGDAENVYLAGKVFEAINSGFSALNALELTQEGKMFSSINIRDITKRKDLERIRGRIIGKLGKTLNTLSRLTNCLLAVHNNIVGIIGDAEDIEDAIQSITSLINGSKQGNVYARLEKLKKKKDFFYKVPIVNKKN